MAYNPYYAPYYRPMNYYNTSIPQENPNLQGNQMPMQQPMQMPIQSNGGLIWVDNEEQAKNYLVAPNNVVPMFDKSAPQMYIKSADGAGMPTFKKYKLTDFEEVDNAPKTPEKHVCECGSKFVGIDKFNALESKFEALQGELDELKAKPKSKATKKIVDEVEDE